MNDSHEPASDENQKEIEKAKLPSEQHGGRKLWIYIIFVIAGLFIAKAWQYYHYRNYGKCYLNWNVPLALIIHVKY